MVNNIWVDRELGWVGGESGPDKSIKPQPRCWVFHHLRQVCSALFLDPCYLGKSAEVTFHATGQRRFPLVLTHPVDDEMATKPVVSYQGYNLLQRASTLRIAHGSIPVWSCGMGMKRAAQHTDATRKRSPVTIVGIPASWLQESGPQGSAEGTWPFPGPRGLQFRETDARDGLTDWPHASSARLVLFDPQSYMISIGHQKSQKPGTACAFGC